MSLSIIPRRYSKIEGTVAIKVDNEVVILYGLKHGKLCISDEKLKTMVSKDFFMMILKVTLSLIIILWNKKC